MFARREAGSHLRILFTVQPRLGDGLRARLLGSGEMRLELGDLAPDLDPAK
jgi:hypothetical protein